MKIFFNGNEQDVAATQLDHALEELDLGDARVATAVNGQFVPATARASTRLSAGDRIETLAPMQGG